MANTLKFGNGKWYGKEGTILAYNDENYNYKPLPFNFERGSSATVVNKDGLIETVGSDMPRIDYKDDSKGALLLEPQRTNLIEYSEDASQWLNVNEIITKDEIISPDGTLSADKFEFTGDGSIRPNTSQLTFIDNYVFSVFIKKGNSRYVTLQSRFFTTSSTIGFDLDNATAESGGVIEDYGNDWFRLSLTNNVTGDADRTGVFYVYLPNELGSMTSVSGNYAYVWGAQVEEGSYATSYIPTNGSAVTRQAETANGSGDADTFNDSEGVLMAEISALDKSSDYRFIAVSDGTNNNRVSIYFGNDNTLTGFVSGVSQFNSGVNILDFNKVLLKYKSGDYSFWVNGFVAETSSSTSGTHANLNEIKFSMGSNSNSFYGKTKQLQYHNSALTDSELEQLTSWTSFTDMAEGQLYTIE